MTRDRSPEWLKALVRFLQVGAVSFFLGLSITAGLHELAGLSEELAYAIALVCVFATNFVLLRSWTYDGRGRSVRSQLGRFFVASVIFRGSEYVGFLLVHSLLDVHYLIAIVGVEGTASLAKFAVYRRLVFEAPARSGD